MILGVPVVATNVGGVSSVISDFETGMLVASNDPFSMAIRIFKLYTDKKLNTEMGRKAKTVALQRHAPDTICQNVIEIYKNILQR
jgi:glycosyltransferase involved in cell wall biosynthesis